MPGHANYMQRRKRLKPQHNSNKNRGDGVLKEANTGLMYSQEELTPGTNGRMYDHIKCRGCDKYGHYLSHCPEVKEQQNLNVKDESDKEEYV